MPWKLKAPLPTPTPTPTPISTPLSHGLTGQPPPFDPFNPTSPTLPPGGTFLKKNPKFSGLDHGDLLAIITIVVVVTGVLIFQARKVYNRKKAERRRSTDGNRSRDTDIERQSVKPVDSKSTWYSKSGMVVKGFVARSLSTRSNPYGSESQVFSMSGTTVAGSGATSRAQNERRWWGNIAKRGDAMATDREVGSISPIMEHGEGLIRSIPGSASWWQRNNNSMPCRHCGGGTVDWRHMGDDCLDSEVRSADGRAPQQSGVDSQQAEISNGVNPQELTAALTRLRSFDPAVCKTPAGDRGGLVDVWI
ncbi:uncharacterized protein BDR25DRAFT_364792 [Lindgomyces ingoldianus]|uniref:Uncharacterized protein n=1 Tax=Lindgomyces ingoldianus TaxID=673940 RepID=A0ACB6RFB2_9PLEO|nr:uncharacterized protein BDR25DRAFT_364792 [Lindgomyces ingoldianus]KAF2477821.1 hypothetical protein BDR25DRAFT_364792 [Lindgomyces ingoldianus]